MIIAPAEMTAAKDQKVAAQKCFDACQLDPDMYRIGHTKARILKKNPLNVDFFLYLNNFFWGSFFFKIYFYRNGMTYLIKFKF